MLIRHFITLLVIIIGFFLNSCSKDTDNPAETSKMGLKVDFNLAQTFGIYEKGAPLTEKNYIKLYVYSREAGKYNITTALINGYKFSATGEFTQPGDYEIILRGEGTPQNEQMDQFILSSKEDETTVKIQIFSSLSNKIIVASGKKNLDTDHIYAVSGRNELLWSIDGSGGPSTVINGIIYINNDRNLVALNIETGQVIWSKDIFPNIEVITDANNILYVSEGSAILHAINPQNGEIIWTRDLPGYVYESGFVVKNNIIYYAAEELYALNTDGTTKWVTNYIQQLRSTPVIYDDRIYVRDYNSLYSVNLNTGDSIWSIKVQGIGSPLYHNGNVYLNTNNNKLCCYNALTKNISWEFAQSDLARSPFIYDNKVFITTDWGFTLATALDAQTGSKLWSAGTGSAETEIIVCDGITYMGTPISVVALNQETGKYMFSLGSELQIWHNQLSVVYNKETKKAIYPTSKGN